MTTTAIDVAAIPRMTRRTDAEEIGRAVYIDIIRLLVSLEPDDWDRPTECAPWTVADMVRHLVGAAKSHISLREQVRQLRIASRTAHQHDGSSLDAMNDLQVRDHAHLGPPQLLALLDDLAGKDVAARMKRPAAMRAMSVPNDTTGSTPAGTGTRIRVGNLLDAILTRDVWMHRIDIANATDRTLTWATHDRRVVEDVIAEWAANLEAGFDLEITSPYSARYLHDGGGERLTFDAVELCRVLSGRADHSSRLFDTRVLF